MLLDDLDVLPDGRIVAATVLGQVDVLDPRTGTSRPLTGSRIGATSARYAGDVVVVTTSLGRVTTVPTPRSD